MHLIATVLGVALIAALVALVAQYVHGTTGPADAGSGGGAVGAAPSSHPGDTGPAAGTTPQEPLPTRQSGPTEVPTSAPPDPHALHVVASWGKAWVHHPKGVTNKQWLAGMKPYTTAEFLPVMSSIDPANITATTVTDKPQVVHSYTSSVETLLPTNGPTLDITVIRTPEGWRVAHYAKSR